MSREYPVLPLPTLIPGPGTPPAGSTGRSESLIWEAIAQKGHFWGTPWSAPSVTSADHHRRRESGTWGRQDSAPRWNGTGAASPRRSALAARHERRFRQPQAGSLRLASPGGQFLRSAEGPGWGRRSGPAAHFHPSEDVVTDRAQPPGPFQPVHTPGTGLRRPLSHYRSRKAFPLGRLTPTSTF